jgi:hypothetical protein
MSFLEILIIAGIIYVGLWIFYSVTETYNRKMTPKDVRMGAIWPLLLVIFFFRGLTGMLNDLLGGFLLLFGVHWFRHSVYKKINKWAWKI